MQMLSTMLGTCKHPLADAITIIRKGWEQKTVLVRMWGSQSPCALLVGRTNGAAAVENSTEFP